MKKIGIILLIIISTVFLIGCEKDNSKIEPTYEETIKEKITTSNQDVLYSMLRKEARLPMEELMTYLEENDKDNEFVKEMKKEFDKLNYEEQSELTKDYLDLVMWVYFYGWNTQEVYNTATINEIYIVGYGKEENQTYLSNQLRLMVAQLEYNVFMKGVAKNPFSHTSFIAEENGMRYTSIEHLQDYKVREIGMDENFATETGVCKKVHAFQTNYYDSIEGAPFVKVDAQTKEDLDNYYEDFLKLMKIYKESYFDKKVNDEID